MLIYPAIDLIDGRCVRLLYGDFAKTTRYGDPLDQVKAFADSGAAMVHVVDLDGARARKPCQASLIEAMARTPGVQLQVGGGVREQSHIKQRLETGAERVVIGSVAAVDTATASSWIDEFGAQRLCCAFDVRLTARGYEVVINGWLDSANVLLDQVLTAYAHTLLSHVLITDTGRDGALAGPNLALVGDVAARYPALQIQASGGVSHLNDVAALRDAGAAAAIIGRALYDRRFTLEDALAC